MTDKASCTSVRSRRRRTDTARAELAEAQRSADEETAADIQAE
ncbi:hypothetical protein ACFYWY_18130 [Streptomyces sp. NPDC002870]